MTTDEQPIVENIAPEKPTLSVAARRERLAELAEAIGESAVVEGDKLIVETGEPVATYYHVEPDGEFLLIRWMTASSPSGHPRWREAAEMILQPGESIYTSALGGGFLVESERRTLSMEQAVVLGKDATIAERVQHLATEFPEAVALLDPEPVPDYLLLSDDEKK